MSYKEEYERERTILDFRKVKKYKENEEAIKDLEYVKDEVFKLLMSIEGSFIYKSECGDKYIDICYKDDAGVVMWKYMTVEELLEINEIVYIKISLL